MIIRALNTIGLVAAIVLAVGLYRAKTEAHAARERLDQLVMLVEEERRAGAVLRAEIAFLERPERLRALAARHLGLEPTALQREVSLEETLLALGVAEPGPTRMAAAPQVAAPQAVAAAAPVAVAPVAVAAVEPAPVAAIAQPVARTQVAEIVEETLAPVAGAEPPPAPRIQIAPRAVAQLEPERAPDALRDSADPIAGLIIAAGGLH